MRVATMRAVQLLPSIAGLIGAASAIGCPYMTGELDGSDVQNPHDLDRRQDSGDAAQATEQFLSQFYLNDNNSYLTSDVGGPISDQNSLKAGPRGPTLLEDFIFRQKIQHFDHERVCLYLTVSAYRMLMTVSGARTCCPCSRNGRPRSVHFLRRLLQHYRIVLPERSRQTDARVRAILDSCRKQRQSGYGA
jgi:hypothetical protein